MNNLIKNPAPIYTTLFLITLFLSYNTFGAVTVTPAPDGTGLNTSPGAFLNIGDIEISENNKGDFAKQTNKTLILSAPAGFEFQAGAGTVSYNWWSDFNSASINVTLTTITVTISVGSASRFDVLTISGIKARATLPAVSGNILRTGGTATVTGDAAGGGVNHGYLSNITVVCITTQNGNWSNPSTWIGGIIPGSSDSAIINHTITANVSSTVMHLAINSGGNLTSTQPVTVNSTFKMRGTGIYTHNNNSNVSTTIFKGSEDFGVATTIVVKKWYSFSTPLAQYFSGNFGNVILDAGGGSYWDQKGMFSPNKIKGDLTISSGGIDLDAGSGMTTTLTLQNILVNGSANLLFARGPDRNLTLITGNYTDVSTSPYLSAIMYHTYGTLNWQCNGTFTVNHDFSATQGTGSQSAVANVTITNDLNIQGGLFDFNYLINGSLNLTVGGNTTISCPSSAWSHLIQSNSQALIYTTTNLYLTGNCSDNYLQGSIGNTDINILNDFISSGTDIFQFVYRSANSLPFDLTVGRDLIINNGTVSLAVSNQTFNVSIGRNLVVNNPLASFIGQGYTSASNPAQMTINGDFNLNAGTVTINSGRGNTVFNTSGDFNMSGGKFVGMLNGGAGNWGTAAFSFNNINYTGGVCYFFDSRITDGRPVTLNVTNNMNLNFPAISGGSHVVMGIRTTSSINPVFNMNIGGNLTISGHQSFYFLSNSQSGNESISINGNFTMNGAKAYFGGSDLGIGVPHDVTMQINGDVNINNGQAFLSSLNGQATVNVAGNVNINGGTLNLKWDNGPATMSITGGYSQSGGNFNFHGSNNVSLDLISVNVYGNFNQTNGVLNFDSRVSTGNASNRLNLYGPFVSFGGTGVITHANHLSSNTVFGNIYFIRNGTIQFSRTSATHDIRHVKEFITSECTVDATSASNNFQIASFVSNATFSTYNSLTINGTLNLGTSEIFARQETDYYSAVTVNNNGKLITAHPGGLYSGSASPSAINSMISGKNRMNYYLYPTSTIEYNGTSDQAVTGIPNGIANSIQHKYGILNINFQGTPDVNFVYPETSGEVFIRSGLILTAGEFNLDNDHDPISGGRAITVENGANISRIAGFIRSEVSDGSAEVRWNITSLGTFIVPFGFNSLKYIPFSLTTTAGVAGDVRIATYHSNPANIPYPPGVLHVRDTNGIENSAKTVDRFWKILVSGNPTTDLIFNATNGEVGIIASPVAQRWIPANNGWEIPQGIQSNPGPYSTLAAGITDLGGWWTLSAGNSPLPVQLVSFTSLCEKRQVKLEWATASEINNAGFEIQKNISGNEFKTIGFVAGRGTTSGYSEYAFTDPEVGDEANYRLKQIDFDGQFRFSETIRSKGCKNLAKIELLSSSIESGNLIAVIQSEEHTEIKIRVFDSQARLIHETNASLQPGLNKIELGKEIGQAVYIFSIFEIHGSFSISTYKVPLKN